MEGEVAVYNPEIEDFKIKYALHDAEPKEYIVKGLQMAVFPSPIAEHIKKHLADKIFNMRGKKNYPQDIIAIIKEISDMPK